ncbi:MAG: UvrD-helicase domain-containing protein [Bacteroidetes bacterium]|nr:UvrD-helicase domain-containing protein [Bacteroidota bacterium]
MALFPNDKDLTFPHVYVIPASAGSGKTFTLAHRYVQFILSPVISSNSLRNILAITFTKLAAKEMKERILKLLKEAALENSETLNRLAELLHLPPQEIVLQAQRTLNGILEQYSDFNIRTIDSFLTTVFKASSFELGIQPDVEITFDYTVIVERAFQQFSREMTEESDGDKFIQELLQLIEDNESSSNTFLWNPFKKISREVQHLQNQLSKYSQSPVLTDYSKEIAFLKEEITAKGKELQLLLEQLNLPVYHHFKGDLEKIVRGNIYDVAQKEKRSKYFNAFKGNDADVYAKNKIKIELLIEEINTKLSQFMLLYAGNYYHPFVRALLLVEKTMQEVQLLEGSVVLDDINRSLARYLSTEIMPEVYLKLGDRIAHFMIDEFQDTSPVQWQNLLPLIEESVSKNGSLFAVGDTKQSIYGFRGADWHIFKNLIDGKYFPSALAEVLPLTVNYRSAEFLVNFVKQTFTEKIIHANLKEEAEASGLYNFAQDVPPSEKGKGYVEVRLIEKGDEEEKELAEQQQYVLSTITDLSLRGFAFRDIALLTPKNDDVVKISSWLNNHSIPFLSLSTLDIRKRKIIGELLALLRFFDSPIDDFSFAEFLYGDIFKEILRQELPLTNEEERFAEENFEGRTGYFYVAFKKAFPKLWGKYFDRLFGLIGYLPLYDFVSETIKTFTLFQLFPKEESALIKLLECVKVFESSGSNSVKDFLSSSDEMDAEQWSLEIPDTLDAVRLMTIHKAKGLGFPATIVFLKESRQKTESRMLIETDGGIEIFRLTKETAARNEMLVNENKKKIKDQNIDELNKLYVAFTRAQKELYILTTYKKKENLPASILEDFTAGEKYQMEKAEPIRETASDIIPLYKTHSALTQISAYEKIGLHETERGDIVHAILSHIEFLSDDISSDIQRAIDVLPERKEFAIEKENLIQFLSLPEIRIYFTQEKNRAVQNEKEISSSGGRLYRMDRVIIESDRITVVDFKTGTDEKGEEYNEQVHNYMEMLSQLFPAKTINGALLYVDMRKAVVVS